jgi:nickel-type superoxide dismutase maturation protease
MEPTLKEGESVLVSSLPYLFSSPKTGEIVVIKELHTKKFFVKRIKKIENGKFFVAGDNPDDSLDSRKFGWLNREAIAGKVVYYRRGS